MLYIISAGLILLALLQVTVVPAIPLLGVRPDLVLLVVLSWTMVRGTEEGAVGAFVGGLALDAVSSFPLGSHAAALLLTCIPVGRMGAPFYRGNLFFPIVGAFLATVVYHMLLLGLSRLLGHRVLWGDMLWRVVLPTAMLQATLMPSIYWLMGRLDRRLRRRPAVV